MLNADLSFDLSAIMAEAAVIARRELAARRRFSPTERHTWQAAMSYGLRRSWQAAKGRRMNALWRIEQDAEAAALAKLPAREQEIARLQDCLAGAAMIDSRSRMVATVASIEARLSELRA